MDFGKIPVDKVAYFIAGIIPGGTAIYVYFLANPSAFHDFLMPNALGYRTKLCIAIGVSFVVGNSITLFVFAVGGALRGAVAGAMSALPPRKQPQMPAMMPWREPKWRKLAAKYLGDTAPADTLPLSDEDFSERMKAIAQMPETEQPKKASELAILRKKLESDDGDWSEWYRQFADRIRAQMNRDFTMMVAYGIRANLETTGVYLLLSTLFVPVLRNWVCFSFSIGWVLVLLAETYSSFAVYANPWNMWLGEMDYLADQILKQTKAEKNGPDGDD